MKHAVRTSLMVAGGVQLLTTARVLTFAAFFGQMKRSHPELFDSHAAAASVAACLAAESEMVA